jgi:hypothetical protein
VIGQVVVAFPALVALSWKECFGLTVLLLVLLTVLERSHATVAAGSVVVAAGAAALAGGSDGLAVAWLSVPLRVLGTALVVMQLVVVAMVTVRHRPRPGVLLTAGLTCLAVGGVVGITGLLLAPGATLRSAYPLLSVGLLLAAVSSSGGDPPAGGWLLVAAVVPLVLGSGKLMAGRIVAARDREGGWDEMVAHYQRAIWLDPTGLAPRRELAHSLSMAGRVEAALEVLRDAAGLTGLDVPSPAMRAVSEAEVGLWSHAAFTLMPKGEPAGRDWEELGSRLRSEVESRRTASRAHLNMAWYLRLSGRSDESAEVLRTALLAGPRLRGLHYNLGIILEEKRLKTLAQLEFEAEVALYPDSPDAWLKVADEESGATVETLLEAEMMHATVGRPAETGWGLFGEGELQGGFFLPEGGWRALGVVARGSKAENVWPVMSVWLDESEAGKWLVCGTAWTSYWLAGRFAPGAHLIRVRFENDFTSADASEDRNLWVDKIVVTPAQQTAAPDSLLARLGLERVRLVGRG